MNGKSRDMDYKFAIKVLSSTKVDTVSMHGNPKRYGYQNQTFYDIARNMAIQALKEKHERAIDERQKNTPKLGEWISADILPETDDNVLVWFEYFRYGSYNRLYQTIGISHTFMGKWSSSVNGEGGWQKLRIIAWMPLPQPYKGE